MKVKLQNRNMIKKSGHQILANDSTPLCYSKKTRYSGIILGGISRRIGGYNLTQVIFHSELSNLALTIRASSLADL